MVHRARESVTTFRRRIQRANLQQRSNGHNGTKPSPSQTIESIMTKLEGEPLRPKVLEILDRVRQGEVQEAIFVEKIQKEGKPASSEIPCGGCGGILQYSRGPFIDLSGGSLLLVQDIWAYRCRTRGCLAGLIFLPEVTEELVQEIQKTPAHPIENASISFPGNK